MPLHPYVRIAVLFIAVCAIWLLLSTLRDSFFGSAYSLEGHVMSAVLASLLTVPLIVAMRRKLDGGTLAGLGLPLSVAALKPFVVGALAFLVPSAIGFAAVLGFGWASITPMAPTSEIILFVPLLIVLVILFEALPEELAFRGYIYTALAERHARIVAIIAQALLFALWGAILWTIATGSPALDRLVMFAAIAFVLGLVRATTGSVWACIGLHTAYQTVAQLVLSEGRDHFALEGGGTLQLVALGIVPFSLAVLLVSVVYRDPVALRQPQSPAEETGTGRAVSSPGSAGPR